MPIKKQDYRMPAVCQNEVCDHDSHCNMCGWGQFDYDNPIAPKDKRKDDLSWCRVCNADICGNCDCGHDKWGA